MVRKTSPIAAATTLSPVLIERALGAYLGLAVGDALGATVEFMTPREIRARYNVHSHIVGGGWLKLRPGQVTDDTAMSLSLGRALLKAKGINPFTIAQAFSKWMRSKPVDIGNTVRRGILHFRNSGQCEAPASEHDAGNGACMRSLPIALSMLGADDTQIRLASRAQAHITHNNALSDAGTECVIRMVQRAIQGGSKQELEAVAQDLVNTEPLYVYSRSRRENPSGYIVDTLQTVFQSLFANDDFETSLVDAVNRGGDADTTGAILGMIAGAFYGQADIPKRWREALDKHIVDECTQQAMALLHIAPLSL